jgi:gluconate kinase
MFGCKRCSSSFDDYGDFETHAEAHLVVTAIPLDDIERSRVISALLALAAQQESKARGHTLAGPTRKDTRDVLRRAARDCRALAEKIRKAALSP